MDWAIYARDPNGEGVLFPRDYPGLESEPIWQLRVEPHPATAKLNIPGEWRDEWGMILAPHCHNVDFYTCWQAARDLQLPSRGRQIGGE